MRAFLYRWRVTLSIVFAVAIFIGTVGYVLNRVGDTANTNKATVEAVRNERITSRVAECLQQAEFRREFPNTLRELGEAASSTGGVDLTALPEFAALDQNMKNYLEALSAALSAQPGTDSVLDKVADDFAEKFPVPDCKAVERQVRDDLTPD